MEHSANETGLTAHIAALGSVSGPMRFFGSLGVPRGIPCSACGREVRLLEERHMIDGRAFHTVCVPPRH